MPTVSTEDKFVDIYENTDDEGEGSGERVGEEEPVKLQGPTSAALEEATKKTEAALGEATKKKKKKKKKSKKKKAEVSGFEEFYVETPLTPEQFKEAEQIYSPGRPFNERIEICIQRYKSKRKFDPLRLSIFDQYLNLGGIRAGQKQFGGGLVLDDENREEEPDALEIAMQTATDFVDADMKEDEWYVDFEMVAKAFFSHYIPFVIGLYNVSQIATCCKLVGNFLNYVLYHNVAAEYTDNIKAALAISRKAEEELSMIGSFGDRIPGKFNKACAMIFGGSMMQYEIPTDEDRAKARLVIEKSVASMGTAKQKEIGWNAKHLREENIGVEILEIQMPPRGSNKDTLGRMLVKPWVAEGERMPKTDLGTFELWLEKQALQYAFVGMKFECHIHWLSSGMFYFEHVTAIQCSFYTYLEPPHHKGDEGDGEVYSDAEHSARDTSGAENVTAPKEAEAANARDN